MVLSELEQRLKEDSEKDDFPLLRKINIHLSTLEISSDEGFLSITAEVIDALNPSNPPIVYVLYTGACSSLKFAKSLADKFKELNSPKHRLIYEKKYQCSLNFSYHLG